MQAPSSSRQTQASSGPAIRFVIGIDGGGTGTRARLQTAARQTIGFGQAGPSGLGQGIAQAWQHIEQAVAAAFAAAGRAPAPRQDCALGLGLAGAARAELCAEFLRADPGYGLCVLDNDARSLLIGAHRGQPGIVVAAGTGSVAARGSHDGRVRVVGGWGFPVGDEGGGAWLGLRAMQVAHTALDGRAPAGPLAQAVYAVAGRDAAALLVWCGSAGQNAYARLAPLVFDAAAAGDAAAAALLQAAADELARLARALLLDHDPLPICLAGSIGERLAERWPADLRALCVAAAGDGADGALQLAYAALDGAPPSTCGAPPEGP